MCLLSDNYFLGLLLIGDVPGNVRGDQEGIGGLNGAGANEILPDHSGRQD